MVPEVFLAPVADTGDLVVLLVWIYRQFLTDHEILIGWLDHWAGFSGEALDDVLCHRQIFHGPSLIQEVGSSSGVGSGRFAFLY